MLVLSRSFKNTTPSTDQEQKLLYEHFTDSANQQTKNRLINNFRHLFLEEKQYYEPSVRQALQKILKSSQAKQDFPQVLTRCCYILIYRWYQNQTCQNSISNLLDLFKHVSPPQRRFYRSATRQRQLVYDFISTEEYQKLQRIERLIQLTYQSNLSHNSVGELITQYFCLHEPYLLAHNSPREAKIIVSKIKRQIQQRFQHQLQQFIVDLIRHQKVSNSNLETCDSHNPTLLSNLELITAIKHLINPLEGARNYYHLSQNFRIKIQTTNLNQFKTYLYEYLTASTNNKYGNHCFNRQLAQAINEIITELDTSSLDDLVILRTGTGLLNFLLVDHHNPRNHYRFIDLITNIGVAPTIGLLLKVVLLNPKLKPIIEKKLAVLFAHYETTKPQQVPWLVKSVEVMQVALAIYFNQLDLSYAKQINCS